MQNKVERGARRLVPLSEQPDREQLLWITLIVIAAAAPLMRELAWQIGAYVALLLAVRLVALRWRAALPGRWLLPILTLAGGANCLSVYHSVAGQSAGSAFFLTMLALKLMELRARRDLQLAALLVCFLVVVQFLFDQSLALTAYLALLALATVALLADLNGALGPGRMRAAFGVAARLSLQALPLTLALFLLFPRLSAPLWDLGLDQNRGQTGMSDTMEPGAISELVVNGELAFRVRFDQPPPAPNQSYWRGPVLWAMDGRQWSAGSHPRSWDAATELVSANDRISYEVLLEPTDRPWLFALDLPTGAPKGSRLGSDFQLLADRPVSSTLRYRVSSALDYRTATPDQRLRDYALRLPDNITPRMRALVAGWKAQGGDDWGLVQRGLELFNREAFHYTLLPPQLGANPADEFLFETRSGFCEHYASSFALLMRIAGVPSRIVLGYLGNEPNVIGGYHMIWQSDAHAWVEVLIEGRGWMRVDPTAAVDPSRVDNRGASQLLGAGTSVRFDLRQADALARFARTLRLLADSVDATWQNWVLDFSVEDQLALLERLGLGELREYGLALLMVASVSLTLAVILLALTREPGRLDPLEARYRQFCARLARVGLVRRDSEGPRDFGRRVIAERPDLADPVDAFLGLYVPARFGPVRDPHVLERLRELLRGFRP